MKNLIIVLTVIFALGISAQESVKLRLNYEKGATYTQNVEALLKMYPATNKVKVKIKIKVVDVKDGIFITENKVESYVSDIKSRGEKIHYDFKMREDKMGDTQKITHKKVKGMYGAIFMIHYSRLGEFKEVEFKKGNFDTAQFKNSTITFPKEELRVGSIWKDIKPYPTGGKLATIYTVKKITKDTVVVAISGSSTGNLTGDLSGEMIIDSASGMIKSSNITSNVKNHRLQMTSIFNKTMTKE